jgi:PAS domain S-box-containing protein
MREMIKSPGNLRRLIGYGFAVLCMAVALFISLTFYDLIAPNPFLLFWIVVVLSAWFGGLGAGMLTVLLSATAVNWFFFASPDAFDTDLASLLRLTGFIFGASLISILFELQHRAIHERKISLERRALLQQITAKLAAAITPQEAARIIVEEGLRRIGGHLSTVYLLRGDGLEMINYQGDREDNIRAYSRIPLTMEGPLLDAIKNKQPVWIHTLDDYRRRYPALAEIAAANGTQASACFPLIARDRVIGGITISLTTPRAFDEPRRELLTTLVYQCAQALERALLYEKTRQQHEHLRVSLASIGDAVLATDTTGNITFMNPIAQTLTGWSENDAMGKPLTDVFCIINESNRQAAENPFDKVIREGAIVGLANHTLLITRSGQEIPIDDSGAPIRGEDGVIIGVILVFRDITERKIAEKLVEETLTKTLDLYGISRHLSTSTTADEVLHAFAASRSLRGLYQAAALMFDQIWMDDTPPETYVITAALRPDIDMNDGQDHRLDQHPFYSLFRRDTPVLVANVEADTRFEGLAQNIRSIISFPLVSGGQWFGQLNLYSRQPIEWTETELQHIQALVDQVAAVLQSIRRFETEKQARQLAEQANRLKMRFLGMVSHELRTPLTSIKGFASSLLAEDVEWDDASRNQFLTIIDSEADKLKNLIEQLLDLTSMEAGTLRIRPTRQPFGAILDSAMPQLQTITAKHNLVLNIESYLPPVNADSQRIGQVMVNLVQNATKFAPFKSDITISATTVSTNMIRVEICDEGPGIPPEAHDYVFEAFRQIDDPNRFKSGAGLGLAICKGLVEGHGGSIWIENPPDGGTIIAFTLPTDTL